jgi:glycine C-acetyltransferase/8-amino-7-oxononanoate synthase
VLEFINQELETQKQAGLYRSLNAVTKNNGRLIEIDGKQLVNFCSNNYLGLANHPKIVEQAATTLKEFGVGATGSALICGWTKYHEALVKKLAAYKKRAAAILFPTGYQANLGAITALVGEEDTVIIDRLNHASIIDACHLSKAKLQVYKHRDLASLEAVLKRSAKFKKRLIVTDTVFSMDGDLAPLAEIVKLAKRYDAITLADYAHATGVVELPGEPEIVMGTLSKALGSLGGFIAGSEELIDFLRNKARSFIYTTALPPSACAAAIAALEVMEQEPERRERLWSNINYFHSSAFSPIIPIIIGDNEKTVRVSRQLYDRGFFVSAIRPPTVPDGEARLRITITSEHTKEDLECLASSLRELIPA